MQWFTLSEEPLHRAPPKVIQTRSQTLWHILCDVKGCQLQHVIVRLEHTGLDNARDRIRLANVGVGDLCDQIVQYSACRRLCQLIGRHIEELFGICTHMLQPSLRVFKRNNDFLREGMHLWWCVRCP